MKGVLVQLFDSTGAPYASGTDIAVMWFDSELPPDLGMIKGQSAIATTDASGWLSLDLDDVTGLGIGDFGFLVCYKLDGGDHRNSPAFVSKMEVTSMTGTTKLGPLTDYVRNPDWPAQVAVVSGVQKFSGLLAVYDHSDNYVAFQFEGAVDIDWGDGSATESVASGVQAQRNLVYASIPGTIVGTSRAVPVTLTDVGDTVNRAAHGYHNGAKLSFATLTGTTGISTGVTYFVVNRTTDTFQLSATRNGTALTLTTDGSGSVFTPEYKVAVITVTPQAGQNLTSVSLQKKHTLAGLSSYSTPWLDLAINGALISVLRVAAITSITDLRCLEIASIGENVVSDFSYQFYSCTSLKSILEFDTSSGTTFSYCFLACQSLQSIPVFDTHLASDLSFIFSSCLTLQSVPMLDTAACLYFHGMFINCAQMQSVPWLDTSGGLEFNSMFSGCVSLRTVPHFDTSASTSTFQQMFNSCRVLASVPLLDLGGATSCQGMFAGCYALKEIPHFDTQNCTVFQQMFQSCSLLRTIPHLDTSSGQNFQLMLSGCPSLEYVPPIDTSLGTNFNSMFSNCYGLAVAPMLNTSIGTNFNSMFGNCIALQTVPFLDLSAATATSSMFSSCVSLSSATLKTPANHLSYTSSRLSAAALNDIYTNLKPGVTGMTINVTGNYGTTGDNPALVPAGWTVIG